VSISSLSTNLVSDLSQQHRQNPFQLIKQDFSQLASALQSGDLTDAQSAYSSIQQILGGSQGPANTIQNDFSAVGQALQSGDIGTAQTAFSQLRTDVQTAQQSRANVAPTPVPVQDQFVSQTPPPAQQVQQDYTQLANVLQSGNLTDAQSAFAALQQALQTQTGTAAPTNNSTNNQDPILNDFNALGQALSSGNLSQAQSAFTQLQSDVQTAQSAAAQSQGLAQALATAVQGHHHHHHHHGGGGVPPTTTTDSTDPNDPSNPTTTVNIFA
jgi:hypothetical protein